MSDQEEEKLRAVLEQARAALQMTMDMVEWEEQCFMLAAKRLKAEIEQALAAIANV